MNQVVTYRGSATGSRVEVHTCGSRLQRIISLYVVNTTTGDLSFTLDIDTDGTVVEVLDDIQVNATATIKDPFEWVPGAFPLGRVSASSGPGTVGDIIGINGAVGLKYHLSIEVLESAG